MQIVIDNLITQALVDKTFVGSSYSSDKTPRKIQRARIQPVLYVADEIELELEFYPDKDGHAVLPTHIALDEPFEII